VDNGLIVNLRHFEIPSHTSFAELRHIDRFGIGILRHFHTGFPVGLRPTTRFGFKTKEDAENSSRRNQNLLMFGLLWWFDS
jgi:hypothetical protein